MPQQRFNALIHNILPLKYLNAQVQRIHPQAIQLIGSVEGVGSECRMSAPAASSGVDLALYFSFLVVVPSTFASRCDV